MFKKNAIFLIVIIPLFCIQTGCRGKHSYYHVPTDKQADIQFEERIYDFGIAGKNRKITHIYRFKNKGTGDLIIDRIKNSCSCTAAMLTEKRIKPGETGKIKVTFDTKKFTGRQSREIMISSNDPDEPQIKLVIKGVIKTGVAFEPDSLYFGDVPFGGTVTKSFKVLQLEKDELTINNIDANSDIISFRILKFFNENSKGYMVDVTIKPDTPKGILNEIITVHTNYKKYSKVDIPVFGNIK